MRVMHLSSLPPQSSLQINMKNQTRGFVQTFNNNNNNNLFALHDLQSLELTYNNKWNT